MPPISYDPSSENEKAPPLPSAPLRDLAPNIVLQPPLTHRGSGPGIILFLPDSSKLNPGTAAKPLDPEPVQKWAEEGFAVVGITVSNLSSTTDSVNSILKQALDGLLALDQSQLDVRDKFAIVGGVDLFNGSSYLY
jgi:carboxymethylenebutenolidase